MGHRVSEVEEERGGFVFLDKGDGLVGVAAGDGALINGNFDDFVSFDEGCLPSSESAFLIFPEEVEARNAHFWFS